MPNPIDVVPGETIASVWGNQVRDQSAQPFTDSGQRDGSIPVPVAGEGLAYLIGDPDDLMAGSLGAFMDETSTSPGSGGGAAGWVEFMREDYAKTKFGIDWINPNTAGDAPGPVVWQLNVSNASNFRVRAVNRVGTPGAETIFQMAGEGGSSFLRQPFGGTLQLRGASGNLPALLIDTKTDGSGDPRAFWDMDELHHMEWGPWGGVLGDPVWFITYSNSTTVDPRIGITKPNDGGSGNFSPLWTSGDTTTNVKSWRFNDTEWVPLQGGPTLYNFLRNTGSSERFKRNIVDARNPNTNMGGLKPSNIMALKVRRFQFVDGYLTKGDERIDCAIIGFVAEEVEEVDRCLVDHDKDGIPDGVQVDQIVAMAVAHVQELTERIESLEAQLGLGT